MKICNRVFIIGIILYLGIIFTPVKGFSEEAKGSVLVKKTLDRSVDPIIMSGELLKGMVGNPIANLRLYAYHNGVFEPIRFQIDEMTADGDWILPYGPLHNFELSNARFDTWDKLVFMAKDTGDNISKDQMISGYTGAEEIELVDPLTGEKGWCYLLYFSSSVPAKSSLPAYISYNYDTETHGSDCLELKYMITKDGLHSTYYDYIRVPKDAGGTGENFVDRLKIRVTLKTHVGLTIRANEEKLKSDVLAYNEGPIRWIRRLEQYIHIPGGLKAMRVVTDVIHTRDMGTVPTQFNIPFNLKLFLKEAVIRFGTDYSPAVIGGKVYNSSNPQGFLVDGKMSDDELHNFNQEFDSWRVITGKFGTFMTRTILTPEMREGINITMGLIDDITQEYPPERYSGTIGYLYQDWDLVNLKRGTYTMYLEFYYPPHFKMGDEVKYVNCMDHPLKIRVGSQEGTNQPLIIPNLGENYKKLFPKKPNARKQES